MCQQHQPWLCDSFEVNDSVRVIELCGGLRSGVGLQTMAHVTSVSIWVGSSAPLGSALLPTHPYPLPM